MGHYRSVHQNADIALSVIDIEIIVPFTIAIPANRISKDGKAFNFGAGVRFFVDCHWSVNPDLRVIAGAGYYSSFGYF